MNIRRLAIRNEYARAFFAEFLGTFLLLLIANGAGAQSVFSAGTAGNFTATNWAGGLALAFGIWVSVGVSGGHLNPAVTLSMCVIRKLSWKKLPVYWAAQYLGAFLGAAVTFGVYNDALNNFDNGKRMISGPTGTAGIWATYPQDFLSAGSGFGDQIIGTAILLCMILAITDEENAKVPSGIQPLCIGLVVVVIGISFGFNCGYALNPARDLGPRIFTAIAGYGNGVFSFRGYNWFWVPLLGPHVGGLIGTAMYELLIVLHRSTDAAEYRGMDEGGSELKEFESPIPKDIGFENRLALEVSTESETDKKTEEADAAQA